MDVSWNKAIINVLDAILLKVEDTCKSGFGKFLWDAVLEAVNKCTRCQLVLEVVPNCTRRCQQMAEAMEILFCLMKMTEMVVT